MRVHWLSTWQNRRCLGFREESEKCSVLLQEAVDKKVLEEPNQMAIASADTNGVPSVRMVLLKGYDERGFMFYTNYNSRKAQELANGHAALCMYWEPLQRQVSLVMRDFSASAVNQTVYLWMMDAYYPIGEGVHVCQEATRPHSDQLVFQMLQFGISAADCRMHSATGVRWIVEDCPEIPHAATCKSVWRSFVFTSR